jgi:hypothetical protein
LSWVPDSQVAPAQHPEHDVASQRHVPLTQRWPLPHVPSVHTPPHPSLAPHGLFAHVGVQVPWAHALSAPQAKPTGQPPQSTI